LGDQLVALLQDGDRADTFSRWVAQYIAEQMTSAEHAKGAARTTARDKAFQAILALWAQRNQLPDGLRPFKGFEPILRALARLDPEEPRSFYPDLAYWKNDKEKPDKITKLVEFALLLDRSARIMLELVFAEAAELAEETHTKRMLENALPSTLTGDLEAINELGRRRKNLETGSDLSSELLERKRQRIELLRKFCEQSNSVLKGFESDFKVAKQKVLSKTKPRKKTLKKESVVKKSGNREMAPRSQRTRS